MSSDVFSRIDDGIEALKISAYAIGKTHLAMAYGREIKAFS